VIGTDFFDNVYLDSKDYIKLIELVSTQAPEIAHLLVNHLCCYDCDINYAATEELYSTIGNEVPFNTIVEWVNNKKDAE
jgi:hypothetical protein